MDGPGVPRLPERHLGVAAQAADRGAHTLWRLLRLPGTMSLPATTAAGRKTPTLHLLHILCVTA